jgi:ribosomal protein S18 acetylase RimI-like enzyme
MYVRPSSRNLGVGRLLLTGVLDVARENVELIQLSVVKENRPARRLYESVGFLEFGVETKASKYGDQYYMKHSWLSTLVVRRISPEGQIR